MVAKIVIKEVLKRVKRKAQKRASAAKIRKLTKSVDRYNIYAGGQSVKGPVPFNKQSEVKSTLSGRVYTTRNQGKGDVFRSDPTMGGDAANFQDRVRDLIGLDKLSVKRAQKAFLKRRNRRRKK